MSDEWRVECIIGDAQCEAGVMHTMSDAYNEWCIESSISHASLYASLLLHTVMHTIKYQSCVQPFMSDAWSIRDTYNWSHAHTSWVDSHTHIRDAQRRGLLFINIGILCTQSWSVRWCRCWRSWCAFVTRSWCSSCWWTWCVFMRRLFTWWVLMRRLFTHDSIACVRRV